MGENGWCVRTALSIKVFQVEESHDSTVNLICVYVARIHENEQWTFIMEALAKNP
jgi:hypothetical protein